MVIKLNNYKYGYKYTSVAKSQEVAVKIIDQGHNALLIQGALMRILPYNETLDSADEIGKFLEPLCDYDVIRVTDKGICSVAYSARSNNNAIVVTSKCNSNCIMCPSSEHSRRFGGTSSIEDLCKLIEYIPSDAPHLTVTGGEPTLLKADFFKLMKSINEHLPKTQSLYLSNARAFCNRDYAMQFNSIASRFTRIAIPLHASEAEMHDNITQSNGSFTQTVAALHNIAASAAEIEIRIVVSKLNAYELSKIADYIIGQIPRVTCVNFIALEMSGSAMKNEQAVWIDYHEAFRKIKEITPKLIKAEMDVNLYNFPLCCVDPDYWGIACKSISDYKIRYSKECEDCSVKGNCCGLFASTEAKHLYKVIPIRR